jgi:hypothetical protein
MLRLLRVSSRLQSMLAEMYTRLQSVSMYILEFEV